MSRQRFLSCLVALALSGCGGASTPASEAAPTRPTAALVEAPAPTAVTIEEGFAPLPVAVTSFGATTLDGALYVLGGYHGAPHVYSREGQSATLSRLPVDGGQWTQVHELAHGVQGLALVTKADAVCWVGGNRILNAAGEPTDMRSIAETGCHSPRGIPPSIPPLPEGRSSLEAVVVGSTLYVAGGWTLGEGGPEHARWASDVLVLDDGADAWRRIDAPFQRRAVAVAAAAGSLAVIGGLGPDRQPSTQVDVLDLETQEWSQGPDLPSDGFGVAARGVGDAIYATTRDGAVLRWRPSEDAWTHVSSLAFPRFFHQLLDDGRGGLVAVGGIGGMHTDGRTRIVEQVDLGGASSPALRWTMDYPGAAKNRQASFIEGDFLYLFGGNNSLEQHDFEPENFVDEGWRLHIPSLTWSRIAPYPARRQSMVTADHDGQLHAIGGFGHDGTAAVSQLEAFVFDTESGEWSERGGLPQGRTQFGLATQGGRLFAFGGLNYDPSRQGPAAFDHVTDVLATTELTGAFDTTDITLPGPRRAFSGATLGDRYYMVNGMREGFSLVDDCTAYSFSENAFTPMACPRRARLSGHLIAQNDRLVLIGGSFRGEEGMETDASVEVYDPATDSWTLATEALPFDMRHAHVLPYRDRLLVVSTHRDDGRALVALLRVE
ncbi:MAG: Kelch repeat-containing protein [Sandaracinaceae bacterium]